MHDDRCPGCGKSNTVITGGLEERTAFFLPDGIRWWRRLCGKEDAQSSAVPMRGRFRACAECGLVWGRLCPEELQATLDRQSFIQDGSEPVLQRKSDSAAPAARV